MVLIEYNGKEPEIERGIKADRGAQVDRRPGGQPLFCRQAISKGANCSLRTPERRGARHAVAGIDDELDLGRARKSHQVGSEGGGNNDDQRSIALIEQTVGFRHRGREMAYRQLASISQGAHDLAADIGAIQIKHGHWQV